MKPKFTKKVQQTTILMLIILVMAACSQQNGIAPADDTSSTSTDVTLVQSISASTTKTTIDVSELPTTITEILASDYSDYYVSEVEKVEGLGYEVHVKKENGVLAGENETLYFDESGQELSMEDKNECDGDKHESKHKEKECFDLVYPISFEMPSVNEATSTTITITADEDWEQIKTWYEANPTVTEKPTPVYPIEIYFDGNSDEVVEINNETEALEAVSACNVEDSHAYKKRKGTKKKGGKDCDKDTDEVSTSTSTTESGS